MIYNPKIEDIVLTPVVGLDTETNGLNPLKSQVLIIAITNSVGTTYVLDCVKYSKEELVLLMESIAEVKVVVIQNAKFDVGMVYTNYGVLIRNCFDTMLASQIITNGKKGYKHSLIDVIYRYLGTKLLETEEKKRLQQSFIGLQYGSALTDEQMNYAGEDTKYLIKLYKELLECGKRDGVTKRFRLENTLVPVLVKMELGGCLIDTELWQDEIVKWKHKVTEYREKLDAIVFKLLRQHGICSGIIVDGKLFNIIDMFGTVAVNYGSQQQILKLFKIFRLPLPYDGEGNASVKEDAIKTYLNEQPDTPLKEFLDTLLDFREYNKLVTTYGEEFLAKLDENNHVHTTYSQCKTVTGRLSSSSINLQNLPNDQSGAGGIVRNFFIAHKGYKMITSDMSSAEVRIAADYSKEPFLIESIIAGLDMHAELGTTSFSIIYGDNVTVSKSEEAIIVNGHRLIPSDLRQEHKTVLFAKFYKAGAKRVYICLAKHINKVHPPSDRMEVAGKISKAIDERMPILTAFLDDCISEARKKGYHLCPKTGHIRYFDENVYGDAANNPIQRDNASAMKIALIQIDRYLEETNYGRLVLTVHDEVVCEVKEEHAEEVAQVIKKIMAEALGWFLSTVEGGASVKIKHCWEK